MTTLNLDTCADEPIHIPGSIQPHGTLIVCRFDDRVVTQVAANCFELTGVTPEAALGFDAAAFFVPGELDRVLSVLRQGSVRETGPFHMVSASGVPLEVVAHESRGALVLELERRAEPSTTTFDPRLRRAIPQLQRAKTKGELMQLAADQVRRITGFDRVMIYRFDPEWNGHVAAESKRDDLDPFLGLHYPASDIPAQARRLYAKNWLRHIADVDYRPVQLTPTMDPTTGEPLDLSYAHLRSVSPIHVEYLRNMGVRASMSVSLIADGELIGLIACHHYAGPRLLSRSERETAEYIGQALSWNLHVFERADLAERARHVQSCEAELATSLAAHEDLLEGLATPALLSLTGASGVSVVLDEGVRSLGKTPEDQRVREIVAWLREQPNDVIATDHFATHYPAATHWDGVAAGLLATAISRELGEYIVWFRPSIERTIDWAGDPRKQAADPRDGQPARLSPRGSSRSGGSKSTGGRRPGSAFTSTPRRTCVGSSSVARGGAPRRCAP